MLVQTWRHDGTCGWHRGMRPGLITIVAYYSCRMLALCCELGLDVVSGGRLAQDQWLGDG